MTDVSELLKKCKHGFNQLEINRTYVDSALQWLQTWLSDEAFQAYVPQIGRASCRERV